VSQYQKGKTNLDFTEATDSEWQWHHLGHIQVCMSLQTDNHASTPSLTILQAGCPSCRPTNSIKALKEKYKMNEYKQIYPHLKINNREMINHRYKWVKINFICTLITITIFIIYLTCTRQHNNNST